MVSDLHISRKGQDPHLEPSADYLLICGDIEGPIYPETKTAAYLRGLAANYKKVIWVMGNHEFFGHGTSTMDELVARAKRLAEATGTILLHNETCELVPGLRVIGTPLYIHVKGSEDALLAQLRPTDSRNFALPDKETGAPRPITAAEFNKLGHESCRFLLHEVRRCARDGARCIAMTHYGGPMVGTRTLEERTSLYRKRRAFQALFMKPAFLEPILEAGRDCIALWAYGHTHEAANGACWVRDAEIPIVNNPLGFPDERTCQAHFSRDLAVPVTPGRASGAREERDAGE